MMRYNDIEQLFKNRLREEEVESGDWLTPPQFILENAARVVNERKRKRRRGIIIMFFGLSVIGIIALQTLGWNNSNSEVNDKSGYPDQQTIENAFIIESPKAFTENVHAENSRTSKEPDNFNSAITPNNVNENLIPIKQQTESNLSSTKNFEGEKQIHTDHKTDNQVNNVYQLNLVNANPELFEELDLIPKITCMRTKELTWVRPVIINDQTVSETNIDKNHKGMTFFAFGGTNLSTLQMTDVPPVDFELKEYDNFYLGYQIGLGSEYKIGQRWSVTASVSYHNFINKSSYLSNELYDKSNEEMQIDGSISYRSSFDISSPLSDTSKEFLIDVDDYSVEQDHILVNSTQIKEKISVLKTTVGVKYNFVQIDKISVGLSAGLSANTVFGLNNHFESTISYEDVKMMESEFNSKDTNMLNKFFLSTNASIGIDYKFHSNWYATMSTGYETSIGSIRKNDPSNLTKTMLGSINLNVGLRHQF